MPSPLQTTIRDLHRQRGRERRGLTLAEGVRLVEEAVGPAVRSSRRLFAQPGKDRAGKGAAGLAHGVEHHAGDGRGRRAGDGWPTPRHPQGIIAVVRAPRWALADIKVKMGPVLVLDGVQDPGNTGTMLRTALGLGAAGIIALPGTVEVTNPKVLRGSMGAVFRLPWVELSRRTCSAGSEEEKVTLLDGRDGRRSDLGHGHHDCRPPWCWGTKAPDLSPVIRAAGRAVSIPHFPRDRIAQRRVAAGILLYEVTRGR